MLKQTTTEQEKKELIEKAVINNLHAGVRCVPKCIFRNQPPSDTAAQSDGK